jgi:hypothetical protein
MKELAWVILALLVVRAWPVQPHGHMEASGVHYAPMHNRWMDIYQQET